MSWAPLDLEVISHLKLQCHGPLLIWGSSPTSKFNVTGPSWFNFTNLIRGRLHQNPMSNRRRNDIGLTSEERSPRLHWKPEYRHSLCRTVNLSCSCKMIMWYLQISFPAIWLMHHYSKPIAFHSHAGIQPSLTKDSLIIFRNFHSAKQTTKTPIGFSLLRNDCE